MDAVVIAAAMEKAVETAYKAVMKPKEGTILTVAREAAVKAAEIAEESAIWSFSSVPFSSMLRRHLPAHRKCFQS